MEINKQFNNNELVVSLEGRLDTITAPDFENAIKEDINNINSLVIDFAKLEYVSSAGLRILLSLKKAMIQKGNMIIKNVSDEIYEVFEMTGFADFLTIEK